jgi:hypothetical protein
VFPKNGTELNTFYKRLMPLNWPLLTVSNYREDQNLLHHSPTSEMDFFSGQTGMRKSIYIKFWAECLPG